MIRTRVSTLINNLTSYMIGKYVYDHFFIFYLCFLLPPLPNEEMIRNEPHAVRDCRGQVIHEATLVNISCSTTLAHAHLLMQNISFKQINYEGIVCMIDNSNLDRLIMRELFVR